MATYSTNQVRHLYVVESAATTLPDAAKEMQFKAIDNYFYAHYFGADGLIRTDLMDKGKIMYAKATSADALLQTMKQMFITTDATVNGGNPIPGQEYILNVHFEAFVGISEEYTYDRYGSAVAYSGMTKSDLLKELAMSLALNLKKEITPLVDIYLNGTVKVDHTTKASALTGTYTDIMIKEAEQPWILGRFEQRPVNFTVHSALVEENGQERMWGTVSNTGVITPAVTTLGNGKNTADLEYFCLKERGDVYGNISFPNAFPITYFVDPTKEYDYIDIHFYSDGDAEDVQKSPRTLTIVCPAGADHATVNAIITQINTVSGLSIPEIA